MYVAVQIFMKHLLYRLGFSKTNKKKNPGFLLISSNRTFYLTFSVSIIFHIGLIYAIPAVDIFSEGLGDPSSEAIVVDFFSDETSDMLQKILPNDNNQFMTDVPPIEPDMEIPAPELGADRSDTEMAPPAIEHIPELESGAMLLSQTTALEPEIPALQKRTPKQSAVHLQPLTSEQQRLEKRSVSHKISNPLLSRQPIEVHKPLKVTHLADKSEPHQEEEDNLHFPLRLDPSQEPQRLSSEESPEKRFEFGKRRAEEVKTTPSAFRSMPEFDTFMAKRQKFGISKEKETDKNQFGIFAGRSFEEPPLKETVQEAKLEKENIDVVTNDSETARTLELHHENQIEGPVKGRTIIRQPRPPQIDIDIEVELKLKFWVLPDGTIGEVIPIKRGNAKLEQIAIAYLKQWQFEPLPERVPQEKIWGTIPIRFTIR